MHTITAVKNATIPGLRSLILGDLRANRGNWKGLSTVIPYRIAHAISLLPQTWQIILFPAILFYKLYAQIFLSSELHWRTKVGEGLRVFHGFGLVVHSSSVIGSNVILRHNTTIGVKRTDRGDRAPIIGDRVDVGCNAIILGPIRIGNDVTIGAGAVVLTDIPDGCVAVGNPARYYISERVGD
jgi:putative colanic acid biosynthesis acetyltransferase WcaB